MDLHSRRNTTKPVLGGGMKDVSLSRYIACGAMVALFAYCCLVPFVPSQEEEGVAFATVADILVCIPFVGFLISYLLKVWTCFCEQSWALRWCALAKLHFIVLPLMASIAVLVLLGWVLGMFDFGFYRMTEGILW